MPEKNIFIATSSFGSFSEEPLCLLKKSGFSYGLNPHGRTLKPEETVALTKACVGLIAGTEELSAKVLSQLSRLRVISRCGTGMDNVDLAKAKEMGIKVYNTPDAPTLAVAELTLGLILDLLRKISWANQDVHARRWKKQMGNLLCDKRVGIIGFGRIGKKIAQMLSSLGCPLAYYDPNVNTEFPNIAKKSLSDLLSWADIVSIHVSSAQQLLGRQELGLLKKGSWLINMSRGGVVDEEALTDLVKSQHIAGAALDVFGREPYEGPLCGLDNVLLTPHVGSYAKEARVNMEVEAVKNLLAGLKD